MMKLKTKSMYKITRNFDVKEWTISYKKRTRNDGFSQNDLWGSISWNLTIKQKGSKFKKKFVSTFLNPT